MNEIQLIKAFLNKEIYEMCVTYINPILFTYEAQLCLKGIKKLWKRFPNAKECSPEKFKEWMINIYTKDTLVDDSLVAYLELIVAEKKEEFMTQIIIEQLHLNKIKDICKSDKFDIDKLKSCVDNLHMLNNINENLIEMAPLGENGFAESAMTLEGYKWAFECLNRNLDPLLKDSDFQVFGGRPGDGKSAFLLQNIISIMSQLRDDERVLWINNEDTTYIIRRRILSIMFELDKLEVLKVIGSGKLKPYYEKYLEHCNGLDRFICIDSGKDTRQTSLQISKLTKQYNIKLIAIDMLDKIRPTIPSNYVVTNDDAKYDILYEWAAEISRDLKLPLLATSQVNKPGQFKMYASSEAYYNAWRYPGIDRFKGSGTAKGAHARGVIMLGRDPEDNGYRYLHSPKNKSTKQTANFKQVLQLFSEYGKFKEVN